MATLAVLAILQELQALQIVFFASGYSFAVLATTKNYRKGKEGTEMDRGNIRISAVNLLNNELPEIKVFLEDKGTLYTFSGVYEGRHSVSSKLLRLMENDQTFTEGTDK